MLSTPEQKRLDDLDELIGWHRDRLRPLLSERQRILNRASARAKLRQSQEGRQVRKYERRVEI